MPPEKPKRETKGYSKKGWKKYIVWYVAIAVVAYIIIYLLFFSKSSGY